MRASWLVSGAVLLLACETADGTEPRAPFPYEPPEADGEPDSHRDAGQSASDRDRDGVPDGQDCAPDDASIFEMSEWPVWLDQDRDGFTTGEGERRCVGRPLVGVRETPSDGYDCDDFRPEVHLEAWVYEDLDGDGYGAGEARLVCKDDGPLDGWVEYDGDCEPQRPDAWQEHTYAARDADGDGYLSEATGTVCAGAALPEGYAYAFWGRQDCDDTDAARFDDRMLYVDQDGDGHGAGPAEAQCIGLTTPAGYATEGGDCAPSDASAWMTRAYAYADEDGDGYYVPDSGTVCVGATLPAGYQENPGPEDCDDTNPARMTRITVYLDEDADGEGAGDPIADCGSGRPPAGTSATNLDCAPSDPQIRRAFVYAHVDRDGDGQTVPELGRSCAAALAAPYFTTRTGNDCNDDDASLLRWEPLYPDQDGDGVGAYPYDILCIGNELPAGYSRFGDDDNDQDPRVTSDPDERGAWRVW